MDLLKYLTDTAVLWNYSSINAYNEITCSAGVEIPVRWEIRQEVFISNKGKDLVSKALVHVNQDIEPDSFLYLGVLTDLTAAQILNPKLVDEAFAVKAFKKIKSVTGAYTLRKCYLFGGDINRD